MKDPAIDALLEYQRHDVRRQWLASSIAEHPTRKKNTLAKRVAEVAAFAAQEKALSELERQRADLRTQRRALEAAVEKYKAQQLQVRKPEEYEALSKQISEAAERIGAWESQELDLLFQIDTATEALAAEKEKHTRRLAEIDAQVNGFDAELEKTNAQMQSETEAAEAAAAAVAAPYLKAYAQVKNMGKKPPFVVPIVAQVCAGCHMRVASSPLANTKTPPSEPVFCPNCGRMHYVEA